MTQSTNTRTNIRSIGDLRSIVASHRALVGLASAVFTLPVLLLLWSLALQSTLNYSSNANKSVSSAQDYDSRVLRAAIRVSPATYFDKFHGEMGFELELLKRFAEYSGKTLKLKEYTSVSAMYDALEQNKVDIVSSGYAVNDLLKNSYTQSPVYREDRIVTVYKTGYHRPRNPAHLVGKRVATIANSQPSDELVDLQQSHSELAWQELESIDYIDLLSRIEAREIDVALLSMTDFQMYRGAFPSLGVGFSLPHKTQHRWSFGSASEQQALAAQANDFFNQPEMIADLSILKERYFSPSADLNQVAAHEFARNVKRRLPKHQKLIETVAQDYDVDWRFLAAISYQESNWLPKARSRTGVRGMMMLTRQTASEMGIDNRLDAENSLRGGMGYFIKLRKRLPASIVGPDRDWMALAAYNIGFGHLEDARVLTQRKGGNPNLWHDVKQSLPLLHKAEHYKTTRHGYARGREALAYVQQIRHYLDVLILKDYVAQHRAFLANNPAVLIDVLPVSESSDQDLALSEFSADTYNNDGRIAIDHNQFDNSSTINAVKVSSSPELIPDISANTTASI